MCLERLVLISCVSTFTISARLTSGHLRQTLAEISEVSCSFVGGLSGLHTFFTSRNKSTYEHFRSRAGSQENPYDVDCAHNWQQVPCYLQCIALHACRR